MKTLLSTAIGVGILLGASSARGWAPDAPLTEVHTLSTGRWSLRTPEGFRVEQRIDGPLPVDSLWTPDGPVMLFEETYHDGPAHTLPDTDVLIDMCATTTGITRASGEPGVWFACPSGGTAFVLRGHSDGMLIATSVPVTGELHALTSRILATLQPVSGHPLSCVGDCPVLDDALVVHATRPVAEMVGRTICTERARLVEVTPLGQDAGTIDVGFDVDHSESTWPEGTRRTVMFAGHEVEALEYVQDGSPATWFAVEWWDEKDVVLAASITVRGKGGGMGRMLQLLATAQPGPAGTARCRLRSVIEPRRADDSASNGRVVAVAGAAALLVLILAVRGVHRLRSAGRRR